MNPIKSFEELKNFNIYDCQQYWYYVILVNPYDTTKAGQALLNNLNIFHVDSGEDCHYFIPGFENSGRGLFNYFFPALNTRTIPIPGFGNLKFFDREFVEFYRELEKRSTTGWRYSGECELLLFNIGSDDRIELDDFASYNLDDIVRNGRNISEFIRTTINVGKDEANRHKAKSRLDEKFYEMIMPDLSSVSTADYEKGWNTLLNNGFTDNSYYFISYSTKDYKIVSEIRSKLQDHGIHCWMAPFDIPSGTNYAWIIEHAIKHAGKFVLMLSEAAVQSVWVGKELKRAITLFQMESPEKICVAWLRDKFLLNNTPFALPLEDIQNNVILNGNPDNFQQIIKNNNDKESNTGVLEHKRIIEEYLLPQHSIDELNKILEHIRALASRKMSFLFKRGEIYEIYERIKHEIECMGRASHIYDSEYFNHYYEAINLINIIMKQLNS